MKIDALKHSWIAMERGIEFLMSSFLADANLCFKGLCTSISKDGDVPLDVVGGGVVGGNHHGMGSRQVLVTDPKEGSPHHISQHSWLSSNF